MLAHMLQVSIGVKPVLSGHSKGDHKKVFKTDNHLMQVKSTAECCMGALSYHMALIPLFCLFLSDRLKQVSLWDIFLILSGKLCCGYILVASQASR